MPKLRPTAARGKGGNCEGATRAVAMDRTRSARLRLPLSLGALWVLAQPNEVEEGSVFLGRGARSVDDATFPLPRLLSHFGFPKRPSRMRSRAGGWRLLSMRVNLR